MFGAINLKNDNKRKIYLEICFLAYCLCDLYFNQQKKIYGSK